MSARAKRPALVVVGGVSDPKSQPRALTYATKVACPDCGAQAGQQCLTRAGKSMPKSHTSRQRMGARWRRESLASEVLTDTE